MEVDFAPLVPAGPDLSVVTLLLSGTPDRMDNFPVECLLHLEGLLRLWGLDSVTLEAFDETFSDRLFREHTSSGSGVPVLDVRGFQVSYATMSEIRDLCSKVHDYGYPAANVADLVSTGHDSDVPRSIRVADWTGMYNMFLATKLFDWEAGFQYYVSQFVEEFVFTRLFDFSEFKRELKDAEATFIADSGLKSHRELLFTRIYHFSLAFGLPVFASAGSRHVLVDVVKDVLDVFHKPRRSESELMRRYAVYGSLHSYGNFFFLWPKRPAVIEREYAILGALLRRRPRRLGFMFDKDGSATNLPDGTKLSSYVGSGVFVNHFMHSFWEVPDSSDDNRMYLVCRAFMERLSTAGYDFSVGGGGELGATIVQAIVSRIVVHSNFRGLLSKDFQHDYGLGGTTLSLFNTMAVDDFNEDFFEVPFLGDLTKPLKNYSPSEFYRAKETRKFQANIHKAFASDYEADKFAGTWGYYDLPANRAYVVGRIAAAELQRADYTRGALLHF